MAAITADGRQELVALYLTMFDRAPTTIELAAMVVARENGSTLVQVATTLATNTDFALVASKDADSFATYLANALLVSDTPAAARTWAINWVVTNVQGTKSKAQVIAEAVQAIRATANTNYTTAKAALTADVTVALTAIDNPVVVGQTYTLSTSATDVVNGASSGDTIIGQLGQSVTLQSSDNVNGGGGNDVFRVVSDGAGAQTAGGFTVSNVETLEVQAQAVGGTTLSLENVTGVTTIRSSSSSADLTLNQVKAIAGLEVVGSIGTPAPALTVTYQAAATGGAADIQNVALNGNTMGALTVSGIETFSFTTSSANSTVASIASTGTGLATVTAAGDKTLTITAALPATVKTVDSSAQTAGGLTVALTNAADVAVKGGAGVETVTFTGAFTSADSFDGGAGRDTIIANVAEFTAGTYSASAKISNVENINFADALTVAFDASKITGEDTYILAAGFTGTNTISKVTDASTIDVRTASTGTLTVSIGDGATLATAVNTVNTLNIAVGKAGTNIAAFGTIDASGVETLKITSSGVSTTAGGNTLTVVDTSVTTLTLAGSEELALTLGGTALTTVDASAATGAMDLSAVTYKAATAATITGGAGADKLVGSGAGDTIVGGAGADTITGAGGGDTLTGGAGADTFAYNAASDSAGSTQDTVADFVSGTDFFSFTNLANSVGRSTITLKNGAATDFGNAQSSIALNSGVTQVVFQADTNTLWVDLNDDGTLNNNDLAIKLTGVTKLVQADVGGTSGGGNAITLSAPGATVNKTTNTNASAMSTDSNDFITTTAANYSTSTIDGAAGTDTLIVTDALPAATMAAVTAGNALVTNIETLLLQGGTTGALTASATVTTISNTHATNVSTVLMGALATQVFTSSSTGVDTVTLGAAGQNVSTGGGNDVINTTAAFLLGSTFAMGDGTGDTLNLTGVAGTVTFAAAAVSGGAAAFSGIENITVIGGSTINITPSAAITITTDATAVGTTVAGTGTGGLVTVAHTAGAANLLTLSGTSNFAVTGSGTGGVTSTSTGTLSVTATNAAQTITSAGALTVNAAALASTLTLAGAGNDTVTGLGTVAGTITEAAGNTGTLTVTTATGATAVILEAATAAGASTINVAGTGAVTYTAVAGHVGVHTINLTNTGAITVQAASTATTYTITTTSATAHTYVNSSTTSSVDTYTGSSTVDNVTLGLGADIFTSGGGADVITIAGATDTSAAVGINGGAALPVQGQAINVSGMDIINGFSTGATVVTGAASGTAIVTNGGTLTGAADTTANLAKLNGTYNSGTGLFTVDTAGTSTLIAFDSNGTAAGGSYVGVVLVGYTDTGGADTWAAGTFTAV